jgi:hypothetical protein
MLCISIPRSGQWLHYVIVVIIYLVISRVVPGDAAPLAAGGVLGIVLVNPGTEQQEGR